MQPTRFIMLQPRHVGTRHHFDIFALPLCLRRKGGTLVLRDWIIPYSRATVLQRKAVFPISFWICWCSFKCSESGLAVSLVASARKIALAYYMVFISFLRPPYRKSAQLSHPSALSSIFCSFHIKATTSGSYLRRSSDNFAVNSLYCVK